MSEWVSQLLDERVTVPSHNIQTGGRTKLQDIMHISFSFRLLHYNSHKNYLFGAKFMLVQTSHILSCQTTSKISAIAMFVIFKYIKISFIYNFWVHLPKLVCLDTIHPPPPPPPPPPKRKECVCACAHTCMCNHMVIKWFYKLQTFDLSVNHVFQRCSTIQNFGIPYRITLLLFLVYLTELFQLLMLFCIKWEGEFEW
jgi:hypothetical protein